MSQTNPFEIDLDRRPANYQPLTPLSLLERSAGIYPDKTAIIHGSQRITYSDFWQRSLRLASALSRRGIGRGDTVSVMAPNTPQMLEAHFGVPMSGAVLNSLNIRLDGPTIGHILEHGEAKILLTDTEFAPVIREALAVSGKDLLVIDIDDPEGDGGERLGSLDYEDFLKEGTPDFEWIMPEDEWDAISLNYTSGTTGNPKGVVCHHRGAYLAAMSNPMMIGLGSDSIYLWTLPMFHCNGWCFTWGVSAMGATHVCLRKFDPATVFRLIEEHGVTHQCGAPIILNAMAHAPEEVKLSFKSKVVIATGGAAPPSPVIAALEPMGFEVIHLYGLTEVYGPATICAWQKSWDDLDLEGRASKKARQGVVYPSLNGMRIGDPETLEAVPADGETLGELMLRGNTVMKGYLKNLEESEKSLKDGRYRTGDLGVMHPTATSKSRTDPKTSSFQVEKTSPAWRSKKPSIVTPRSSKLHWSHDLTKNGGKPHVPLSPSKTRAWKPMPRRLSSSAANTWRIIKLQKPWSSWNFPKPPQGKFRNMSSVKKHRLCSDKILFHRLDQLL